MADSSAPILFHLRFASGEADEKEGIIRGVSLITGSLAAEGHELEVDDMPLKQVCECAAKMGKVPVKLNHGSGAENICGYIDDFNQGKAERNSDAARRNAPSGSMSPRFNIFALTARACECFSCERWEIDAYGYRKAALLT